MTFSLHSLSPVYESTSCYFEVEHNRAIFRSPFYPDKKSALDAIRAWLLGLRANADTNSYLLEEDEVYKLRLFGEASPVTAQDIIFSEKSTASKIIEDLQKSALAKRFDVSFLELADEIEELSTIQDLDLSKGSKVYNWEKVGSSAIVFDEKKAKTLGFLRPSIDLEPNLRKNPCNPIFSPLTPQIGLDLPLFKGRDQEVNEVYSQIKKHDLLLCYGLPKVGKTSLIQCGLANKLKASPNQFMTIVRAETNLEEGLKQALNDRLASIGLEATENENPIALLQLLQSGLNQPLYLVFDQLERLFHTSIEEVERVEFFSMIREILAQQGLPVRIILLIREEYLAPLADYEEMLPMLLENRFHLHRLRKRSMVDLTVNMFDIFTGQGKLNVDQSNVVSEKICQNLVNEDGDVPFQCLEIYLHELQQKSCKENQTGGPPVIDSDLIDRMGPADNIINNYIDQQLADLEAQLPEDPNLVNPGLQQQIDDLKQCRQQCGCEKSTSLVTATPTAVAAAAAPVVGEKKVRRLSWLLVLTLLTLLLSLLGYFLIFSGLDRQDDPCFQAKQINNCASYINYLSQYGEEADCSTEFKEILEERQCNIWRSYQMLQRNPTCGTYLDFFNEYPNSGFVTDMVRARLIEWGCPIVRDTVEITLRDTIIERVPSTFNQLGGRINNPSSNGPPCQEFDNSNFKRVGPLWIMTDALAGGPFTWEDALDACKAKGWRLPCIGEIDFLVENIYSGQADRAYQMLTGSGDCYLVNPASRPNTRIYFWTGTEANDAFSWSFYFDTGDKSIGRERSTPKSNRLPCLCVQKDANSSRSGLPPCYQKNIDRN